mmetsp:Transcript_36629/g.56833  ORF Transcript_36629/g.56833 Transcript_36629/m.56833 type:complete len:926 (+) Transcript_36629:8-2785(+)
MSRLAEVTKAHHNAANIRNICVIAHVDHGKTTLSDSLIASNGIISQNLAGNIRYLDNRKDEQERLITMKSSNISLLFRISQEEEPYLVNLIDSPGHVDFSGEVSSAVRLSDGAIVVVDAVEGVCNQTHTVLRQAWDDRVKPCLVINKIDRLITELQLEPEEAYLQLNRTLESVNVIMATLFAEDMLRSKGNSAISADFTEEELDDSDVFFSPEQGNVVFACAKHGWGFRISHFAEIYAKRLNMNKKVLNKTLWGEYFFCPKDKSVKSNSNNGKYPRMFVQFILQNLWHVHKVILEERSKERTEKVLKVLGLKAPAREMRVFDDAKRGNPQTLLTSICRQWLPLSSAIIRMCIEKLPSPLDAQKNRIPKLYSALLNPSSPATLTAENTTIEKNLLACDSSRESAVVLFISKVFAAPLGNTSETIDSGPRISVPQARDTIQTNQEDSEGTTENKPVTSERFIGFGRIFSGTLRKGDSVYVLGPKYNPHFPDKHVSRLEANELFVLMGRGLEPIEEIPAGNVFGLGGIDEHILKTATISSTLQCFPMLSVQFSQPIVRVAVEPRNPTEMPILMEGLKKLNQADSSVEVFVQESGEHVINAAGEMHLERCLRDLQDMFAPIQLEISPPIVSFKETITKTGTKVQCRTRGKVCTMNIVAKCLPRKIVEFLEQNTNTISTIFRKNQEYKSTTQFRDFQSKLLDVFVSVGWTKEFEKIWSFGPKRCGPNILFNFSSYADTEHWKSICVTEEAVKVDRVFDMASETLEGAETVSISDEYWKTSLLQSLDFSMTNGFQLATAGGPLCEEPLSGVAFFIEDIQIERVPDEELNKYGPFKGQIMPTICQGLRDAFVSGVPHLVEPYYSCLLQVPSKWFGDATSVLLKRRAKICNEQFLEGTDICMIEAHVPVVESFGFAPEIMQKNFWRSTNSTPI